MFLWILPHDLTPIAHACATERHPDDDGKGHASPAVRGSGLARRRDRQDARQALRRDPIDLGFGVDPDFVDLVRAD
jgi:hypothetical protein